MLQYACDWCRRTKRPGEEWILGYAAERIGAVSRRIEITIATRWTETQHPLAVHFCTAAHKDKYIRRVLALARKRQAQAVAARTAAATGDGGQDVAVRAACKTAATKRARKRARRTTREEPPAAPHELPQFTQEDHLRARGLGIQL